MAWKLNWIETKQTFSNLGRLGVNSISLPRDKFDQLIWLVEDNSDIGGRTGSWYYGSDRMVSFFGVRIDIDDV